MARRLNLKSGMHERYTQFGSIAAMGKKDPQIINI